MQSLKEMSVELKYQNTSLEAILHPLTLPSLCNYLIKMRPRMQPNAQKTNLLKVAIKPAIPYSQEETCHSNIKHWLQLLTQALRREIKRK